jgi:dephospho-CoA kinase
MIIGLVGRIGAGKDTAAEYLVDVLGAQLISMGDMVRHLAAEEGVEPTRENLNRISDYYLKLDGPGFFPKMVAKKIKENSGRDVVITSVRTPNDITVLRRELDNDIVFLWVEASQEMRYKRLKLRASARDTSSHEEFLKQDENEERIFKLSESQKMTDYSVVNESSLEELHMRLDEVLTKIGGAVKRQR